MIVEVTVDGLACRVEIASAASGQVQVAIGGRRRTYEAAFPDEATLSLISHDGGGVREFAFEVDSAGELRVIAGDRSFAVSVLADGRSNTRPPHRQHRADAVVEGRQNIVSAMPGRIVRVLVAAGEQVTVGQPVLVVEAMKMENELRAPKNGVVRDVRVTEGVAIEAGAVLVVID